MIGQPDYFKGEEYFTHDRHNLQAYNGLNDNDFNHNYTFVCKLKCYQIFKKNI